MRDPVEGITRAVLILALIKEEHTSSIDELVDSADRLACIADAVSVIQVNDEGGERHNLQSKRTLKKKAAGRRL